MHPELEKEKRKLSTILAFHTIGFVFAILCITGVIFSILIVTGLIFYLIPVTSISPQALHLIGWYVGIASIAIQILIGLTNVILSIVILATNWKSKWCKERKILWGLLSLLLLHVISIFIFCCSGKRNLKYDEMNNYNYESYSGINQLNKVTRMRSANIAAIVFCVFNLLYWISSIIIAKHGIKTIVGTIVSYIIIGMSYVKVIDFLFDWFMVLVALCAAIKIMTTKWENQYASNTKKIYGPIALVFALFGMCLPFVAFLNTFGYFIIDFRSISGESFIKTTVILQISCSISLIIASSLIITFASKAKREMLRDNNGQQPIYPRHYPQNQMPYQQPYYPPQNNNSLNGYNNRW